MHFSLKDQTQRVNKKSICFDIKFFIIDRTAEKASIILKIENFLLFLRKLQNLETIY